MSGRAGVQTQVIWLHFRGNQPTLFVYGVLELHCQKYKKCLSGLWSGDAHRSCQSNVTHYGWVFAWIQAKDTWRATDPLKQQQKFKINLLFSDVQMIYRLAQKQISVTGGKVKEMQEGAKIRLREELGEWRRNYRVCVEGLPCVIFQSFLMFQAVKNSDSDLFYPVRARKKEGVENSSNLDSRQGPPGMDSGTCCGGSSLSKTLPFSGSQFCLS